MRRYVVEVSIYNKFRQLKDEKIECPDLEKANDIIRTEIRCMKKKIKNLNRRFKVNNVADFLHKSDEICKCIFNDYSNSFFGTGDFYKLTEIKKRIKDSSFKEKSKILMIELAKSSATHSSLDYARKEFESKHDKYILKSTLKRFDKIGISPIVLPKRFSYDKLENPLTLALDWMDYE